MNDREKRFILKRRQAIKDLDEFYTKMDQAAYGIVERMNSVTREVMPYLTTEEKELLHKRYQWFTGFLRHFRLGEDCLHLIKEMEVFVELDQYDQWSEVE